MFGVLLIFVLNLVLNIMFPFMDDYSHYTWLYPMTNKSDVLSVFIKWQK